MEGIISLLPKKKKKTKYFKNWLHLKFTEWRLQNSNEDYCTTELHFFLMST